MSRVGLVSRVDEVLEHYDYALVKTKGESTDNQIKSEIGTAQQLFRFLTIHYGANRVSKTKGMIKITDGKVGF